MKNLSLCLLLLALFAGGYWVLSNNERSVPEQSSAQESDNPSAPRLATGETPSLGSTSGPSNTSEQTVERTDLNTAKDLFSITVVEQGSENPLSRVKVLWHEPPEGEWISPLDYDQEMEAHGTVIEAGSEGVIQLPRPQDRLYLLVKDQGYYGRLSLRKSVEKSEFLFPVLTNVDLKVHVALADGTPAAGLRVSHVGTTDRRYSREQVHARTDEHGNAIIRHLQMYSTEVDPRMEQAIVVGVAAQEPPIQYLVAEAELLAEMEFQLPPTSMVEVQALQSDGSSFPDGHSISLQAKEKEDDGWFSPGFDRFDSEHLRGWDQMETMDGAVSFRVALGQELEYALHYEEHRKTLNDDAPGPLQVGEPKILILQEKEELCWLIGRLLDGNGAPLAGVKVDGYQLKNNSSSGIHWETDQDGRFRIPLNQRLLATDEYRSRDELPFREILLRCTTGPGAGQVTKIDLSRDFEPGENDLGDIILNGSLLVSGQVVDADGNGIPKATLRATDLDVPGNPTFRQRNQQPLGSRRSMLTDEQGFFSFHTTQAHGELRLTVSKKAYQPSDVIFYPQTADLLIPLSKAGDNHLKLVLLEGMSRDTLQTHFRSVTPGVKRGGMTYRTIPEDLVMPLGFLSSGVYEMTIRVRSTRTPIVTISDLRIGADVPQDPRLNPLDLHDYLQSVQLQVVEPDGSPAVDYQYRTADGRSHKATSGEPIFLSKELESIEVWTKTSRITEVLLSGGEQTIRLQAAYRVRLLLSDLPQLEPGGYLVVQMHSQQNQDWVTRNLHDTHTLDLNFKEPGTYVLEIMEALPDREDTDRTIFRPLHLDGSDSMVVEITRGVLEMELNLPVSRPGTND